jgi:tRNA-modifying protein YgfZ
MITRLAQRGVVRVCGPDAATLLNGLLTNDVSRAGADRAVFAAMLTPQGKYLFDMFVLQPQADTFLLDVSRAGEFAKRLSMYRLRSQVTIEDVSGEMGVFASSAALAFGHHFNDPRLAALGWRTIAPIADVDAVDEDIAARHALGVPDASVDLLVEKDFIMEGLFDELHGLDHHKGCYVGQEMTSRMKRRTSVKNKLCRVRYAGSPPTFETPILADNWEVGRMRSGSDRVGIAMIRFDRVRKATAEGHALLADGVAITLDPPDWLQEPEV